MIRKPSILHHQRVLHSVRPARGLGVLLLGLVACRGERASETAAVVGDKAIHVETVTVEPRAVPTTLSLTGTLEADQRTDLAANASGRVIRTFVERGDHVRAGALIAQLDSRSAALTQVEAQANARSIAEQLAAVRAECARVEALLAKSVISQAEYDRQSSQCRTQAASEEAARARAGEAARVLQDTGIRAPFAGVIAERYVSIGDYVQASSKVVTLLVDDPLRLKLTVPEPAIAYAREGVVVTFTVLDLPDRTFSAAIRYVGREVRSLTRDVVDEAIVDNHDGALLPGMFATVLIPTGSALWPTVPKTALVQTDTGPTLFALVDGRLQQRAVHAGVALGDDVAVSEGLKRGDRVVVRPSAETVDGILAE